MRLWRSYDETFPYNLDVECLGACPSQGSTPTPVDVTPGAGSGSNLSMVFTFSDADGYQDLGVLNILINSGLDGRQGCYMGYDRPSNVLFLVNDASDGLSGLPLNGGSGTVSNSQCTASAAGSSFAGNGNTLTLMLNLSFSAAFAGNKVIYLAARDAANHNSGWQALGTRNVPGPATAPVAAVSVSPARGSGSNQAFTFTFTDTKGASDLGVVNMLINTDLNGIQACYLGYDRRFNLLFLVNDASTQTLPALALNGTGSLTNSQCTVNGVGSSVSSNGNTLTLVLNVTFKAAFIGNRVIYLAARDAADGNNTGWQSLGSWTVR